MYTCIYTCVYMLISHIGLQNYKSCQNPHSQEDIQEHQETSGQLPDSVLSLKICKPNNYLYSKQRESQKNLIKVIVSNIMAMSYHIYKGAHCRGMFHTGLLARHGVPGLLHISFSGLILSQAFMDQSNSIFLSS